MSMNMDTRKSSLPGRLLAAAVLAAGFGTIWFALAAWLDASVHEARQAKSRIPRESLVIAIDGEPLVASQPPDDLSLTTARDLAGAPRDPDQAAGLSPTILHGDREGVGGLTTPMEPGWPDRVKVFRDQAEPAALWYFVHDGEPDGSGGFVGYERFSNRLIGRIGLAGFREAAIPPEDRIPVSGRAVMGYSYWSSLPIPVVYPTTVGRFRSFPGDLPPNLVHVPSGKALRVVDLSTRTVETRFEASEPIVSVGVPILSMYSGSKADWERPILVRTASRVYKLDHQYKLLGTFAIPDEVGTGGSLSWYEAEDGRSTVVYNRPSTTWEMFGAAERTEVIDRLAPDGSIRETREVALKTGAKPWEGWEESAMLTLTVPAPVAMAVMGWLSSGTGGAPGRAALWRRFLPALAAVGVLSILLAAAAWRWGRAFGLSGRERAAWAAFVLCFGLPAFVGFLLHRRWPARVPCPHCRARSPRDRDACLECGAPFPTPARLGTEIFA